MIRGESYHPSEDTKADQPKQQSDEPKKWVDLTWEEKQQRYKEQIQNKKPGAEDSESVLTEEPKTGETEKKSTREATSETKIEKNQKKSKASDDVETQAETISRLAEDEKRLSAEIAELTAQEEIELAKEVGDLTAAVELTAKKQELKKVLERQRKLAEGLETGKTEEKPKILTPEEQSKQKIENEYPKEREAVIIEKGIDKKLSDPNFEAACRGNILRRILADSELSERDRRSLRDYGDFSVKGFMQKINKRDVLGLVAGGMSIKDIKNIKVNFFTGKVGMPDGRELTSEEFDKEIEDKLKAGVRETAKVEVIREWERRKKEWVDSESVRVQAHQAEAEDRIKQAKEKEKLITQGLQEARAKTSEAREKKEQAENMSDGERLKIVSDLRNDWNQAKKIFSALNSNKKIKINSKEVLDPKNERDRKELEDMKTWFSDDIIEKAEELTGRDLKSEAKLAVGRLSEKEAKPEQKDFQKWLTDEVQKIYKEQFKKIEPNLLGTKLKKVSEKLVEELKKGLPDFPGLDESKKAKKRETVSFGEQPPVKKPGIKKGKKLKTLRRKSKK